MPLGEGLQRVLAQYPSAVTDPIENHPLAAFIRGELAENVRAVVGDAYQVTGSPGQGNWAGTPWVSIFDPSITTSARVGYYVCYLFHGDGSRVYLSLNQATTEVRQQFPGLYRRVLSERAEYAVQLLQPFGISELLTGPLDLGSAGGLTRGYEAGNIGSVAYAHGAVPDDDALRRDLLRLLGLYGTYRAAREGALEGGVEDLPADVRPGEEARKYRWHRRAERNRRLARAAKVAQGYRCKVCGFDFEEQYGELGREYIEAHHLVPFAQLSVEPEPVVLDPTVDFTVVCANCHRMLHRTDPSPDPDALRGRLATRWDAPVR